MINDAHYVGPGLLNSVLETPLEVVQLFMQGNLYAPLELDRLFLPEMIRRGSGTIVHMTSAAAFSDPVKPRGEGGWGISYGVTKAALHRATGFIVNELATSGIKCFNVQPGTIAGEQRSGFENRGEPAEVVGAVVAWLATDPRARSLNGQTIEAPFFCHELGLLPEWAGPELIVQGSHDLSAAVLTSLEDSLRHGDRKPRHYGEIVNA